MQNDKLLPCPFCGGEDLKIGSTSCSIGVDNYIKCACGIKLQLCEEYGWDELTKRWNTRKPMERIVEQLEEEQEGLETDMWARECDNWYGQYCNGKSEGIDIAIDIVRRGGVDNAK